MKPFKKREENGGGLIGINDVRVVCPKRGAAISLVYKEEEDEEKVLTQLLSGGLKTKWVKDVAFLRSVGIPRKPSGGDGLAKSESFLLVHRIPFRSFSREKFYRLSATFSGFGRFPLASFFVQNYYVNENRVDLVEDNKR